MKEKTVHKMRDPMGAVKLLFATEAYSMGTDAPNISRIIHFCPPSSLESMSIKKRDIYCLIAITYPNNLFVVLTAYLQEV